MQKPESSLQKSRTIGNYIITKNLGEGTFGKVKLGLHSTTGEKVAIKILQKSKIVDVADVERVTRQIHILKQIRHPNLIQLYEIIQTPKQLFLVMQYVSEGQLFEHIVKKKKLKQNEACEYFRQLIAGVQYMHQLNIVHRDLKPQNLLIDFNKRLKIVDFGLSNTYKNKQMLKTACGSPCYAAPEMIAGKKYHGLAADIWSCGVILFAMICGYLPFQDPNTSLLYKKITAGDFTIPKTVSPFARQLLMRVLTTDPDRRYKVADIKNHAWYKQPVQIQFKHVYGIKVGLHTIPIQQEVLQQVISAANSTENVSIEQIKKFISNNRHNHAITIYYLILKRNLRNGIFSAYDICSSTFQAEHLTKKALPFDNSKPKHTQQLQEIQLDRNTTATGPRAFRTLSRGGNTSMRSSNISQSPNITAHNFYVKKNSKNNSLVSSKASEEPSFDTKIDMDHPQFNNILEGMNQHQPNSQRRKIYFQAPKRGVLGGPSNNNGSNLIKNPERQRPPMQIALYDVQQKRQALSNYYHQQQKRPNTNSIKQPATFRTSLNNSYRNSTHARKTQEIYNTIQSSREGGQRDRGNSQVNDNAITNDRYVSLDISQINSKRKSVSYHQNKTDRKEMMNKTFVSRIPKVYGFRMESETDRIKSILNSTIASGFGAKRRPTTKNSSDKYRFDY